MSDLKRIFLQRFANSDYILQQKSRVLLAILLSLFVIIPFLIITTRYRGHDSLLFQAPLIAGLFLLIIILAILRSGHYKIAAHMLTISLLVLVWLILLLDYEQPVMVWLTTTVYIPCLLFLTPLLSLRKSYAIVLYYSANILVFIGFIMIHRDNFDLSPYELSGYVNDYIMVFLFSGIVSYLVFTINSNALNRALESEMEVQARNEELAATNEEFEAINEELIRSQEELAENSKKYRLLYDNALVGMATIQWKNGIIRSINNSGAQMLGYESSFNISEIVSIQHIHPDSTELYSIMSVLRAERQLSNYELKMKRRDGSIIWTEIMAKSLPEQGIVEVVFTNITKRKIAEENVHKLTFYDSLTGLPNRRMFISHLSNEILKSRRKNKKNVFAVMCIGIDKFKNINDMHGPVVGDELLKTVASRLKSSFREDDIICRIDGDKFMILFSDIGSYDNVIDLVRKTSDNFQIPFPIMSTELNVTSCLGMCMYPNDGEKPEVLIKNSETAMYTAKGKGTNAYHLFDARLNNELINRLQLEDELEKAILKNEFQTYYQPIVDCHGFIRGLEALIRWNSPKRGLLDPSLFIPLAEKNGMIISMGNAILREACLRNREWQDAGFTPMRVSVNISPFQFRQPDLIHVIADILQQTGLDPRWLELEITESGIMEDEKGSIRKLNEIHAMGISITVDDFGTGYSSLSKLRDYPIDALKIDKSFVDKLPFDQKSCTIAVSIIDLAHNLGFRVVAEGIENMEQYSFLYDYNCDLYQGFLFGSPSTTDEIIGKMEQSAPGP